MTLRNVAAAALFVLLAAPAFAQSKLPVADAAKFMGDWDLGLDSPQGHVDMTLKLTDASGMVSAVIGTDTGPIAGSVNVNDVSIDAGKLVLKYELNFQGMPIPTEVTLIPDGEKWKANFNFAGGQFMVDGTAVKK
jgi:hypothetical protein